MPQRNAGSIRLDGEVITPATGASALGARCWRGRGARPAGGDLTVAPRRRALRDVHGLAADRPARRPRHGRDLAERRHRLRPGAAERRAAVVGAARLAAQRHFANSALCSGNRDEVDPRFVRMVEQSTGLKGLKFETDPNPSEREMQPVMDAPGPHRRLLHLGADVHPMTLTMTRLMPVHRRHRGRAGGLRRIFAVGSSGARGANWRRARSRQRAPPTRTSSPACPTTPRRSNCSTSRLAERAGDDVITFALIELDGMADVNAHLGVLGSDELIVAVAKRLKAALPAESMCGRIGSDEFARDAHRRQRCRCRGDASAPRSRPIARPHWIETVVRI